MVTVNVEKEVAMDRNLFITELMKDDKRFCELAVKVTEDPKKMVALSKLCQYVYDLGAAKGLDALLP
jgi:hypothetical protein